MLRITEVNNLEQIYHYQRKFHSPYFFVTDFVEWKKSFEEDIDGEGRTLFKELSAKAAYDGDDLIERFENDLELGRGEDMFNI